MASITEVSPLQGVGTGVIRRALEVLATDGLIIPRPHQTLIVAGEPPARPHRARGDDQAQATTAIELVASHMSVTQ